MSNPAANLTLNSLNYLTGIELTKPLILSSDLIAQNISAKKILITGDSTDLSNTRSSLGIRTFTKLNNESRQNDLAAYANDAELKDIPLEIGKSYKIEFCFSANITSTNGGCKVRLVYPLKSESTPIGCGIRATSAWGNGNATIIDQTISGANRFAVIADSIGYSGQVRSVVGTLYTGILAASGNLSMQWAQSISGVNITTMYAGSLIIVTEL